MAPISLARRSRLAIDGGVLLQPPPPPVVRVSCSMGVCIGTHQPCPLFASRDRWGCVVPTTTSACRSRLAFDGVAQQHHHLSFDECVPAPTSTPLSRLAFDVGLVRRGWLTSSPPELVCVPHSAMVRSRHLLSDAFDVVGQPPQRPLIRISCSLSVCLSFRLSFASCSR